MNVPPTAPLPRSPEMSQDRDRPTPTEGGPRRVLLADDERLLHTVLGDVLEGYGYAVLHAMDGEEAVREARESRPDLILMDIMMPVMTGLEALERLKGDAETRGIPVVAITADVLGRTREAMLARRVRRLHPQAVHRRAAAGRDRAARGGAVGRDTTERTAWNGLVRACPRLAPGSGFGSVGEQTTLANGVEPQRYCCRVSPLRAGIPHAAADARHAGGGDNAAR